MHISGVRRDLALVNALAHRLSHPLDVERVLDSALETLAELLQLDTGWAWLWSESTATAHLAAKRNLPPGLVKHPELMEGDCYCLTTYAAGDLRGAANVNVVGCSRLARLVSDSRQLRCHASVPLYVDDRRLGILNVASADWRELTTDELNLLSTVGALGNGNSSARARLDARGTRRSASLGDGSAIDAARRPRTDRRPARPGRRARGVYWCARAGYDRRGWNP